MIGPELAEAAVWQMARYVAGCDERWAARREQGLTDDDLRAALAQEFGIFSGYGEGGFWVETSGSLRLRFGIGAYGTNEQRLSGKSLLAAARRVLRIPLPASTPQQAELAL